MPERTIHPEVASDSSSGHFIIVRNDESARAIKRSSKGFLITLGLHLDRVYDREEVARPCREEQHGKWPSQRDHQSHPRV
jgi:hypothetical protein